MATITNINGTSDTICKCGSWLKHWQNFSGESIPAICPSYNCYQTDLVGAHVQKANSIDKKWYIVPLCQKHNKSIEDVDILNSTTLVSADKKETCER